MYDSEKDKKEISDYIPSTIASLWPYVLMAVVVLIIVEAI